MSLELLENCYLFHALNDEQRDEILKRSRRIRLSKDEVLFQMGDEAHYFYLMERGQAKLSLNSSRGVEKVIAVIRTGDVFAEAVTFFENKCYPADCTALQDSVVLGIDMHQFAKFLYNSNELCMALLRDLSGRLHRKINEIRALALENATIRTLGYLYSLIPAHSDGQIEVRLDTPKQTIASILSITPETFSRVLNQLSQEGLVVLHERDILINDISALKERLFFQ